MKRVLFVVTAAVAALTIGLTSASAAQPKTNAAAARVAKTFVSEMNADKVGKLYLGFAPNQRKLFTQKQFNNCFGKALAGKKSFIWIKYLETITSTKTTIPGYRGSKVANKRVVFKMKTVTNGKAKTGNTYLDVAYVKGAWHWWFTALQVKACSAS